MSLPVSICIFIIMWLPDRTAHCNFFKKSMTQSCSDDLSHPNLYKTCVHKILVDQMYKVRAWRYAVLHSMDFYKPELCDLARYCFSHLDEVWIFSNFFMQMMTT